MIARFFYEQRYAISLVALLGLAGIALFYRLGTPVLFMWDESRYAVNALEMIESGDVIVPRWDGAPDLLNSKPPMAIWLMAASMKLLGPSEFSARLPSAIAALTTIMIVTGFCVWRLHDWPSGIASGLVLATSIGFIGEHAGRTGDMDALLTLWITGYTLAGFAAAMSERSARRIWIMLAALCVVAAFLTKSTAGFLGIPGVVLALFFGGGLRKVLGMWETYAAAITAILACAVYIWLRESATPGYVRLIYEYEILRASDVIEQHTGDFRFYIRFLTDLFSPWAHLVLPAFAAAMFLGRQEIRRVCLMTAICGATFLLILSSTATKTPWYMNPLYPMGALVVGLGFSVLLERISLALNWQKREAAVGSAVIASLVFAGPVFDTLQFEIREKRGEIYEWNRDLRAARSYGWYLPKVLAKSDSHQSVAVMEDGDNWHLTYYSKVAGISGHNLRVVEPGTEFQAGTLVVSCNPSLIDTLSLKGWPSLYSEGSCATFKSE
jgi:4-amino-4-deoxy-L-arabinose transferase-like glycosyltransferase